MLVLLLFLYPEGATPAEAISKESQRAATQLCINSLNSSRSIGLPVTSSCCPPPSSTKEIYVFPSKIWFPFFRLRPTFLLHLLFLSSLSSLTPSILSDAYQSPILLLLLLLLILRRWSPSSSFLLLLGQYHKHLEQHQRSQGSSRSHQTTLPHPTSSNRSRSSDQPVSSPGRNPTDQIGPESQPV